MRLGLERSVAIHYGLGAFSQSNAISYIHGSSTWGAINIYDSQWGEAIERDVCVVGGGSSGVQGAVSLADINKTVILIEKSDHLGGHCTTYVDPETKTPVDYGVVIHQDIDAVTEFFDKFGVPIIKVLPETFTLPGAPVNHSLPALFYGTLRNDVDFRDGSAVNVSTDPESVTDGIARLIGILSQYSYLLEGGNIPDPLPEDLLLPFGAFLQRHHLEAVIPRYYQFSQGMGSLLHITTIYVVKYYNLDDLRLAKPYLTVGTGHISDAFAAAGEFLGPSNVLLGSVVVASNRTADRMELLVSSPSGSGNLKLLSCGQILYTIPPTLENLAGWDLSAHETAVFKQYTSANGYWTGLVTGVGLNQTESYWNAAKTTASHIPVLPALYNLVPVGVLNDTWLVKFGADTPAMDIDLVKRYIARDIRTLQQVNNVSSTTAADLKFLAFESHAPFQLQVSPEVIRAGFFNDLAALQGGFQGRMFYSGAAFHTHYTSLLWRFNKDIVIPLMANSSGGAGK
ncbi:hypothetical protein ONZ43_g4588 [Nemania bipapillata]|uniref:Uncharacterized protein n=1 Tax=Nemania bipapillata TaxID=110536 RepID=A0ACC2IKZ3_9PEZI|nr:hypothetical protein ONZ43_g4588 [Nemania bipapillata]